MLSQAGPHDGAFAVPSSAFSAAWRTAAASTPITSSGQWWESALSHVGGGDCGMQDAALAEGALLQPASSAIGGAARLRAVPRQEGGLSQQPQPPSATPSTALLTPHPPKDMQHHGGGGSGL